MNKSQQLLSDIVVYNKYAKYNHALKRRETWTEIVERYLQMMRTRYPDLIDEINDRGKLIHDKKILPSMRALQFAGPAVERNEARMYNCAYMPIDSYHSFAETMFLLLSGCGVGYSVQKHHIANLPIIHKGAKKRKYVVADSIEGWADAIKALMKGYFGKTKTIPNFDFRDIRPKGARLVTSGGKAPGPEPLKRCLMEIQFILDRKKNYEKLTSLECHDIQCHIADAVLAGGIRRAAMISLFDVNDNDMINAKAGAWWELNPQRGRANNSAILERGEIDERQFKELWQRVQDSGSGEPGFYWTHNKDWGTNPCCEIALKPYQFCNLCEINAAAINTWNDFKKACHYASFFGTLQAGFTDFHYLRPIWKETTEEDALIGVGITGIAGNNILNMVNDLNEGKALGTHISQEEILKEMAREVRGVNSYIAKKIGINTASRSTTIKPSGTTSCVLGTSSGIHAWHAYHYIRNMQCRVGDDLYNFFMKYHPDLITIMEYDPMSAVIATPQVMPMYGIAREHETVLDLLTRIKLYNTAWIHKGHRKGDNMNNVSATVSIKPNEWIEVGNWMWENRNNYNGLSVLPYDGGTYKNAPFETITKEKYTEMMTYIENNPIDLTLIKEDDDNTEQAENLACAGGSCELIF